MTGELRALVYKEVSVHEMKNHAMQDGIRISLKYKLLMVLADTFLKILKLSILLNVIVISFFLKRS
jgi:hypothetical protein